jgi:hypothetical protein
MAFEPILGLMKKMDILPTRENYIALNWGDADYDVTPEEEQEMPIEFQCCEECGVVPCECILCVCQTCLTREVILRIPKGRSAHQRFDRRQR